jgi:NodT family efflux transporter outer membrane factor (OMF) lipoprotein
MAEISLKHPGVESAVEFPGLSISGFTVSGSSGIIFICLKPFEDRQTPELSGPAIANALNAEFSTIQEAFVMTVMPPPVNGLGMINGFKLYLEDRAGLGYDALFQAMQGVVGQSYQTPQLAGVFSTFTINVPQLDADIDRVKAKSQGIPLQNLFETLQIYLGSLYVNDFNLFGRTYQVIAQADSKFRNRAEDITRLKTRNAAGQTVPLGSVVQVRESFGPDRAVRYNGYPAAEINGGPAPGFSSGQSEAIMAGIVQRTLPKGMAFEWTDLTYQRILAGNSAIYIYPLSILLVFLVLAAQYESFRLPLAIILVVPLCLLFAIAGVYFTKGDNNIFTQIGLIVLVGLACKNAILIVEFAKALQDDGATAFDAAIEACRLRLRPILMTSIAFIAGVFPLVISKGAGAEMRHAMGVAVFSGMIGVTLFGLFLTPVFYVVLMKWGGKKAPAGSGSPSSGHPPAGTVSALAVLLAASGWLLSSSESKAASWKVGPDYERPKQETSVTFRDTSTAWKEATPADAQLKERWWELFGDSALNSLVERATTNNASLRAAVARYDQARAISGTARSELLPQMALNPNGERQRYSPNQQPSFGALTTTTFRVPLDLSYEVDLWGRVRRAFEAARADAQASVADYRNALLSIQAEVAQHYLNLRGLDRQLNIVRQSLQLRREGREILKARVQAGTAPELDLARAETEVATSEADLARLQRARASIENALAILTGTLAPEFQIEPTSAVLESIPTVPPALPSDLLERRPDVASAERALASANARIGVARAAYFPSLRITGSGGFVSAELDSLFNWDSRVWSLGPSLSIPLFSAGRNRAGVARAQGAYDEAIANYRQRVLVAFGEVQDSLTAMRWLSTEAEAVQRTIQAAQRTADLARARYEGGIASYLEVIESQRTWLATKLEAARLHSQRQVTTVLLVKALGGGWKPESTTAAPTPPNAATKP